MNAIKLQELAVARANFLFNMTLPEVGRETKRTVRLFIQSDVVGAFETNDELAFYLVFVIAPAFGILEQGQAHLVTRGAQGLNVFDLCFDSGEVTHDLFGGLLLNNPVSGTWAAKRCLCFTGLMRAANHRTDHRVQLLVVVLLVVLIGVAILQMLLPQEPVYEGKTLTVWLDDCFRIQEARSDARFKAGEKAIRAIGTNAIPILLEMVRIRDSALKRKLTQVVFRESKGSIRLHNDWEYHRKAVIGFGVLGAAAAPCVPSLASLLSNKDPFVRYTSAYCLGLIGPAAHETVPALIQCLGDSDFYVSRTATWALGQIHAEPALTVPALLRCLDTQIVCERMRRGGIQDTIDAIYHFGPETKLAVLGRLNKMNAEDREWALNVLKRIELEANAKAGAK